MQEVSRAILVRRVLSFTLFVGLHIAALHADRAAPRQKAQAQRTASRALTVERIYSAPDLAGSLTSGIEWNYTTVLNLIFLVVALALLVRFLRTGGLPMLKMMNRPEQEMAHHDMGHHDMAQ